jgi:hypothetical protein
MDGYSSWVQLLGVGFGDYFFWAPYGFLIEFTVELAAEQQERMRLDFSAGVRRIRAVIC